MFKILIMFITMFNAYGRSTFEQIIQNSPMISHDYAAQVAEIIDAKADKYKVPANVIAAIAMVESSYILNAVNKRSSDYGIMQINSYNIKAYKFDKQRLLNDLDYSIDCGVKVFQWFYKRYYKIEHVIQSYNGGTAKDVINWTSTKMYLKKVQKYM